jgi:hypothetical protein
MPSGVIAMLPAKWTAMLESAHAVANRLQWSGPLAMAFVGPIVGNAGHRLQFLKTRSRPGRHIGGRRLYGERTRPKASRQQNQISEKPPSTQSGRT